MSGIEVFPVFEGKGSRVQEYGAWGVLRFGVGCAPGKLGNALAG
jgi:hypothetical protein